MNTEKYEEDYTSSTSISPSEKKSILKIQKSKVWGSDNSSESPTEKKKKSKTGIEEKRSMMSFKMYVDNTEDFQKDEKLPDRIEGKYFYDYNILNVDMILIKKFDQDKKNNLIKLEKELEMENLKISGRQNLIERRSSRKKVKEIEEQIRKYDLNVDKNIYIMKSKSLLDVYRKIGVISTIVSFTSNDVKENDLTNPEDEESQIYRHKIISAYLEIARKYIPIDLIREKTDFRCCPNCGISYDEVDLIEEDGATICPNCGLERINIIKTQFYSDGSRLNNSKNNYEDRANFYKVLLRYQGKQQNKPTKQLYDKLDEYFLSRGLLSSKEYNKLPLLDNGTKKGTSREMMFEALSNINCSGYYDDINLICSVYFGWILEDISHLEDDIMKDYDKFKTAIDNLPDLEGRKSSLNSQWTLYVLLKRRDSSCKSKNFKIPSTPSILEYHKIKTKEAFKVLGWDYFH